VSSIPPNFSSSSLTQNLDLTAPVARISMHTLVKKVIDGEIDEETMLKLLDDNLNIINELDGNNRTPLYRALRARIPNIKLICALLERNGEYAPGTAGVTMDQFLEFFVNSDQPGMATCALILAGRNEEIKDYILALSLSDYVQSRVACAIIKDCDEIQRETLAASTGILSSELNDPLSIILSYVHGELFKPSDVNQVSNNLLKQRISVGKEPRNPSSSSSPRPAESDEQKSGPDIGGRRARVMTRRKKYGTLFIDKESEKKEEPEKKE
jgi:hypothetical protein